MQSYYQGVDNNIQIEDLESENGRTGLVTDDLENANQYLNEGCFESNSI